MLKKVVGFVREWAAMFIFDSEKNTIKGRALAGRMILLSKVSQWIMHWLVVRIDLTLANQCVNIDHE